MGTSAQLADLSMVLGPGARHRWIPNPGAADLDEVCMANPEMGAVTSEPHDPNDLKAAATMVRFFEDSERWRARADRLEAWADELERGIEAKEILDHMTEAEWRVNVWMKDGNHYEGSVDVADRRRLIERVRREAQQ